MKLATLNGLQVPLSNELSEVYFYKLNTDTVPILEYAHIVTRYHNFSIIDSWANIPNR